LTSGSLVLPSSPGTGWAISAYAFPPPSLFLLNSDFFLVDFQGWGGPMTQNWRKGQYELQLKILARERSFGMVRFQ